MRKIIHTLCIALAASSSSAAPAVEPLHSFTPGSLTQIKQEQAGQSFILFLWSLDCTYCQASLEALKAAQLKQGLKIVTISTDAASEAENRTLISAKLDAVGLDAKRWAFGPFPAETLRYAIDKKWWGEIPRTYWLDREGRIIHSHAGALTAEAIRKGFAH